MVNARGAVAIVAGISLLLIGGELRAQSGPGEVELVLRPGRTLRLSLDDTMTVKHVGQTVTATLVEQIYAYDRVVLPEGVKAVGHIVALEPPPRTVRLRSALAGRFSPDQRVVVRFDALLLDDSRRLPIDTRVTHTTENMVRHVAAGSGTAHDDKASPTRSTMTARAKDSVEGIKSEARDALSVIRRPGRMERLKRTAINELPYHPQFLNKGTVFSVELLSPVVFGTADPTVLADASTRPSPGSIVKARLDTDLDSGRTARGAPVSATVTEPVFSADNRLLLPEGTVLTGTVTFSAHARRFHRNGRLRFLFEQIRPPGRENSRLLASLYSIDIEQQDRVALDEEGGARVTNSKTRFVAPAVAILALASASQQEAGTEGGNEAGPAMSGAASAVGGAFGFGLIGVAVSQVSRPFALTVGAVGAVRTLYANVLGKGREVSFPANTSVEVQLAGPTRAR